MSEDHILRYTDLAAIIQMARARGWSTMRIVRTMSSGWLTLMLWSWPEKRRRCSTLQSPSSCAFEGTN